MGPNRQIRVILEKDPQSHFKLNYMPLKHNYVWYKC